MRTTPRRVISAVLALTLATTAGLSQVLGPRRVARSVAPTTLPSAEVGWQVAAKRGEPIELSVREDVRGECASFVLPPEPYVIASPPGSDADAAALEGLAACLSQDPLARYEVELFGPSEFPGKLEYGQDAPAPADVVRSLLHRLGLPLSSIVTRDVAVDPSLSSHAGPRVVLGVAPPGAS